MQEGEEEEGSPGTDELDAEEEGARVRLGKGHGHVTKGSVDEIVWGGRLGGVRKSVVERSKDAANEKKDLAN